MFEQSDFADQTEAAGTLEKNVEASSVVRGRRILEVRPAGPDHQVVTVKPDEDEARRYVKQPCPDCPWRRDAVGKFPAEAFVHSARTAYDCSQHTFACHTAGVEKNAACAGFLLVGATHNLAVRLRRIRGQTFEDVHDGGHELFSSYREMAVANGVAPDHPGLIDCRDD